MHGVSTIFFINSSSLIFIFATKVYFTENKDYVMISEQSVLVSAPVL
jgi:hypothetical protein